MTQLHNLVGGTFATVIYIMNMPGAFVTYGRKGVIEGNGLATIGWVFDHSFLFAIFYQPADLAGKVELFTVRAD